MIISNEWKDYELLDTGDGEKLERWGKHILRRPDPQILWPKTNESLWNKADAYYHRSNQGGGHWEYLKNMQKKWTIKYKGLSFYIEPTEFKHTGLFPEQAINWEWMINKIRNGQASSSARPKVLNLFAYTGGATIACSFAGAEVCHVDASKGMTSRAKENLILSGLGDNKVRFIVDDVFKFVEREIRRGNKYDGIIMDPPSYGRGTTGEVWKIEDHLYKLVELCTQVLSDDPLFFLINSYTTGFSPIVAQNILQKLVTSKHKGRVECGEIGLPQSNSNIILPCGIYGRWEK